MRKIRKGVTSSATPARRRCARGASVLRVCSPASGSPIPRSNGQVARAPQVRRRTTRRGPSAKLMAVSRTTPRGPVTRGDVDHPAGWCINSWILCGVCVCDYSVIFQKSTRDWFAIQSGKEPSPFFSLTAVATSDYACPFEAVVSRSSSRSARAGTRLIWTSRYTVPLRRRLRQIARAQQLSALDFPPIAKVLQASRSGRLSLAAMSSSSDRAPVRKPGGCPTVNASTTAIPGYPLATAPGPQPGRSLKSPRFCAFATDSYKRPALLSISWFTKILRSRHGRCLLTSFSVFFSLPHLRREAGEALLYAVVRLARTLPRRHAPRVT